MQLDLFISPDRFPRRPYCSDDKTARLIRPFRGALRFSYIQANPPKLKHWLLFDLDRQGGSIAWDDAGLPPPAWAAGNPVNGHAHLAWGLSSPVLTGDAATRSAPIRYLAAVESAMRAKLDADEGFSGLITKNPIHRDWRTLWGPPILYELGDLAQYVDLPKHLPKRERVYGVGRNVSLFDDVRVWAYRAIRRQDRRAGFVPWQNVVREKALDRNDFPDANGGPLSYKECYHIARSVAKWVWDHFDFVDYVARTHTPEIQAARGKKGGLAKGAANEEKRASARIMRATGATMAAIAAELGVHTNTVANWLRD